MKHVLTTFAVAAALGLAASAASAQTLAAVKSRGMVNCGSNTGLAGFGQQGAQPTPTDRTKASQFTAADLAAAIAKVPSDRPVTSTRIFTLAPYAVNVERRQPLPQGASVHEAQAELFYVIDGSATLLTGGKLPSRRQHKTDPDKSALQEIMGEVDDLSRDRG